MAELSEAKQAARSLWGEVGDFGKIAHMIAPSGRAAVDAAEVGGGDRVLDVACGTLGGRTARPQRFIDASAARLAGRGR